MCLVSNFNVNDLSSLWIIEFYRVLAHQAPGIFPIQGLSLGLSPTLQADSLPSEPPWKSIFYLSNMSSFCSSVSIIFQYSKALYTYILTFFFISEKKSIF